MTKDSKFSYHGSVGKYATLEKVMGKHKEVHLKKDKGYIDIYIPKSEDVFQCPQRDCHFTSRSREKMFAHIRKTGHSTNELPKRASKFLKVGEKMRHGEYKNYLIHYHKTSNGVSTNIYKDNKMVSYYWSENYKRAEETAHLWIDYKTGKMTYIQYDKRIAKFLK